MSLCPSDLWPVCRSVLRGMLALLVAGSSSVSALDFAALQTQISSHGVTTVEGLIQVLPESLRTHYTLIFQSRSLQGASYTYPRAILFGDDATFVLSFNGDPSQRGYDAVETMQFEAASSTFLFREIRFGEPGTPPSISDANPARCTACHGTPARPIWDTAPSWPGVYGEHYHSGLSARETRGVRGYLAQQAAHPRYRLLMASRDFAERDTYVPSSIITYNGMAKEPPNARLSMLLTQLNTRAIVATLRSQPGYEAHRYVLLAAAEADCGPLPELYPATLRVSIDVQLHAFLATLERVSRKQQAAKAARLADGAVPWWQSDRPLDMGPLRFVIEHDLSVNTASWTLAFERNTYDLAAPPGTWSLGEALLEAVLSTDSSLAELHAYHSFDSSDAYCKRLVGLGRLQLEESYLAASQSVAGSGPDDAGTESVLPEATTIGSAPAALTLCIACHSESVAPRIPFADPHALAPILAEGSYPRGRLLDEILYRLSDAAGPDMMPRGTLLSHGQVQALERYFVTLAKPPVEPP